MRDYGGGPGRVGVPGWVQGSEMPASRNGGARGYYGSAHPGDPGGVGGGLLRTLQVQSWDSAPVPTAQNFFTQEAANLVLAGALGSTVVTTLAAGGALQVPRDNIISIQGVSLFCDAPTLTTNITYTVRANGLNIPGLTNLRFPAQGAGFMNFPVPGPFNVYRAGAFIDVLITRTVADVAKQVNFTMVGWFNSPADVIAWTGVQPGSLR